MLTRGVLSVLLCLILVAFCSAGTIWPEPVSISYGGDTYSVDPHNFNMRQAGGNSQIISDAFTRYLDLIFWQGSHHKSGKQTSVRDGSGDVSLVVFEVSDWSEDIGPDMDESYTLNLSAPNAVITSNEVWGALRALESLSQLISYTSNGFVVENAPVYVQDAPRFSYRGLLLDSSRHFLPLDTIQRTIDAMSYDKLNVLHWHIVDAQSFPIESKAAPRLVMGAWTPELTYSLADIASIVKYAKDRGIRVMPEFDTPGHAYSWGVGYPGITSTCSDYAYNVNNIPLNPANATTYEILTNFFAEMASVFTDPYFHTGGDEVVYGCWKEDPRVTKWMKQKGWTSLDSVMQYWEEFLWNQCANNKKSVIAWEEVFLSYNLDLPSDITIEVWKDEPTLLKVAQASLKGILAYGWYLDHLTLAWTDFYLHEPFQDNSWTRKLESYILGGDICAWGETLNEWNYDGRLWPRTSAAAERLWSPESVNNVTLAQPRLEEHICRLNRRGIASGPIEPGYCP